MDIIDKITNRAKVATLEAKIIELHEIIALQKNELVAAHTRIEQEENRRNNMRIVSREHANHINNKLNKALEDLNEVLAKNAAQAKQIAQLEAELTRVASSEQRNEEQLQKFTASVNAQKANTIRGKVMQLKNSRKN